MFKIGLTGGVASGKTAVSRRFASHGIPIIDADLLAREVVRIGAPVLSLLITQFGTEILMADGSLNRPVLRQWMLSNPDIKRQLDARLHPPIRHLLTQRSNAIAAPYCLLVVPLLFEAGWQKNVDRVLTVEIDADKQLSRLKIRDKVTASNAQALINSQLTATERKAKADDILLNTQDLSILHQQVDALHVQYLAAAFANTH